MSSILNIVSGGVFHAAVLFLVAAGLQIVFGVQKILNVACGAFYALGAYFGVWLASWALDLGMPPPLVVSVLLAGGIVIGAVVGPLAEFLLRFTYDRDEHFALLITFAMVLMFEDVAHFFWGSAPRQLDTGYLVYGQIPIGDGIVIPVYNLIVILAATAIAACMAWFLARSRYGRIVRATAENRRMSMALCINVARVYSIVFTLGVALGTVGGALVVPTAAASLEMGVELIVEAFAVVIIGGLGSMSGALFGALIVGLVKAAAVATVPELELMAIYLIVIAVLLIRPQGLFAKSTT